jgi:hypothetical protein
MSQRAVIYQLFDSELSRSQLDPGFIPLDITASPRRDWGAYWAMRMFFSQNAFEPEVFYGFFTSDFTAKTNLRSTDVHGLVSTATPQCQAILLSPQFDESSRYLNVFEQGEARQPGFIQATQFFFGSVGLNVALEQMVHSSINTVFGNFFLAKPSFWQSWYQHTEAVFTIAEQGNNPLSNMGLASPPTASVKLMLIERMATYLIASQPQWNAVSASPFTSPMYNPALQNMQLQFSAMDALKIAYGETGIPTYLETYHNLRRGTAFSA